MSEASEKDAGNAEDEARRLPRIKAFPKNERTVGEVSGDAGGDEGGNMADGAAAQPATATATHTAQLSSW